MGSHPTKPKVCLVLGIGYYAKAIEYTKAAHGQENTFELDTDISRFDRDAIRVGELQANGSGYIVRGCSFTCKHVKLLPCNTP